MAIPYRGRTGDVQGSDLYQHRANTANANANANADIQVDVNHESDLLAGWYNEMRRLRKPLYHIDSYDSYDSYNEDDSSKHQHQRVPRKSSPSESASAIAIRAQYSNARPSSSSPGIRCVASPPSMYMPQRSKRKRKQCYSQPTQQTQDTNDELHVPRPTMAAPHHHWQACQSKWPNPKKSCV